MQLKSDLQNKAILTIMIRLQSWFSRSSSDLEDHNQFYLWYHVVVAVSLAECEFVKWQSGRCGFNGS